MMHNNNQTNTTIYQKKHIFVNAFFFSKPTVIKDFGNMKDEYDPYFRGKPGHRSNSISLPNFLSTSRQLFSFVVPHLANFISFDEDTLPIFASADSFRYVQRIQFEPIYYKHKSLHGTLDPITLEAYTDTEKLNRAIVKNDQENLAVFLKRPPISELRLKYFQAIQESIVKAEFLQELYTGSIYTQGQIDVFALEIIPKLSRLESLRFGTSRHLGSTNTVLALPLNTFRGSSNNSNLPIRSFATCFPFGEHTVKHLREFLSPISNTLRELDLSQLKVVNDSDRNALSNEVLKTIAECCPKLESMQIGALNKVYKSVSANGQTTSLFVYDLSSWTKKITGCLKSIEFSSSFDIREEDLTGLTGGEEDELLDHYEFDCFDGLVNHNIHSLRSLKFGFCHFGRRLRGASGSNNDASNRNISASLMKGIFGGKSKFSMLHQLSLKHCEGIDHETLGQFLCADVFPRLEELRISAGPFIHCSESTKKQRSVTFDFFKSVSTLRTLKILELPSLKLVNSSNGENRETTKRDVVSAINTLGSQFGSNLKNLDLSDILTNNDDSTTPTLDTTSAAAIGSSTNSIPVDDFSNFKTLKDLEMLTLGFENILDDQLLEIVGETCLNLKSVILGSHTYVNHSVTDAGIKALLRDRKPHLSCLLIYGMQKITDDGLAATLLKYSDNLSKSNISDIGFAGCLKVGDLTARAIAAIASHSLTCIDMQNTLISVRGLEEGISKCCRLQVVFLGNCENFHSVTEDFQSLTKLKELTYLDTMSLPNLHDKDDAETCKQFRQLFKELLDETHFALGVDGMW